MSMKQENRASSKVKQRRVTQACDFCHKRSIKCGPLSDGDGRSCKNCHDFDQPCTYNRKPRRRGVPPRATNPENSKADATTYSAFPSSSSTHSDSPNPLFPSSQVPLGCWPPVQEPGPSNVWKAPYVASHAVVVDLVDLYFEIIYPIFPFFHQPSFTAIIGRAEYRNDRTLFAATMALCSLVSSRVRDGAVNNPRWDLAYFRTISPDTFDAAAKLQLINQDLNTDLNTMRAHALLAIASIQNGKPRDMNYHMGMYHTLVATDSLHDEGCWPPDIGNIEREERRRLFWSMYMLDLYAAVVWGGIIRCREKQSNVAYALEIDDEMVSDKDISNPPILGQAVIVPTPCDHSSRISPDFWLSGWNFIVDIYRILEHALTRLREARRDPLYPLSRDIFNDSTHPTEASVGRRVLEKYHNLPTCYKETPPMTFDPSRDRFAFQAANMTGSLQLLRMVLLAAGRASIDARCHVASEVVEAFVSIPLSYSLALSTPLLYLLGGIGAILSSVVVEESLSESECRTIQSILVSMSQLLENLEPIHQRSGASQTLRDRAARVDGFIVSQRALQARQAQLANEARLRIEDFVSKPKLIKMNDYTPDPPTTTQSSSTSMPPDILDQLAWNLDFCS